MPDCPQDSSATAPGVDPLEVLCRCTAFPAEQVELLSGITSLASCSRVSPET